MLNSRQLRLAVYHMLMMMADTYWESRPQYQKASMSIVVMFLSVAVR